MNRSILGRVFALASDEEQAEILNEAGRMLRRSADVGGFDLQCSYLADKLDDDGAHLVRSIAAMLATPADIVGLQAQKASLRDELKRLREEKAQAEREVDDARDARAAGVPL